MISLGTTVSLERRMRPLEELLVIIMSREPEGFDPRRDSAMGSGFELGCSDSVAGSSRLTPNNTLSVPKKIREPMV